MQAKSILSLVPVVLLCLPSLCGGFVILGSLLLQRRMDEWGTVSSVVVATAVFFGWPLVFLAALAGVLAGINRAVSREVKYANCIIVSLATVATFSVTFHFGIR
ncbi:MAG TPA: hypothetical protein VLT90_08870 [Terriglobales bacterium]|nr:hypothetical protein [Terriglobales bacterium]